MAIISRIILFIIGWKITGNYRNDIRKKIIIMAPHTSSWDLALGITCRPLLRDRIMFIAKSSAFRPAIVGWFLRKAGGIPVNRSKSTNFVKAVVNEFNLRDELTILLAPEGTREKVQKFKSGFYYIARKANIPIILCRLDSSSKEVHFSDPIYLTSDLDAEMEKIQNHFKGAIGINASKSFT